MNCMSSKSSKKKNTLKARNENMETLTLENEPQIDQNSSNVHEADLLTSETDVTGGINVEPEGKESIDLQEKETEHLENVNESARDIDVIGEGSEKSNKDENVSEVSSVKTESNNYDLENQENSEMDLEKLGFVEVKKSDLKGSDTASYKADRNNVKFEMEMDEENYEVFSEFVDKDSVGNEMKVDHSVDEDVEISEDLLVQYLKKNQKKHFKMALRNGLWDVKHKIRHALWFNLCHHLHKADDHDIFSEFAQDLFSSGDPSDLRIPSFVDMEHLNYYHLRQEGIQSAKQILCVLEHSCPDIIHSPLLFSILCLFLHYMDTSQCYNCLYSLLRHKDSGFLPTTKVSYEASKLVIRDLAKKYAKSGYVLMVRNCGNVDQVFDTWIWWIFEDLPFSYLVRVMDCYLNEGVKIFFRVALAILILFAKTNTKKSPKKDSSTSNILLALRQFCHEMPVKVDKLLKTGFSIRGLTRKEIRKLQVKHEMYITSTKHINNFNESQAGRLSMSRSFSGPIVLQNLGTDTLTVDMNECLKMSSCMSWIKKLRHKETVECELERKISLHLKDIVLRNSNFKAGFKDCKLYAILKWIPTRYAICQPELLYTSEEHGTSLVTLYQRVENHQPTIIVIKTTQDEVFGAFCSTCWRDRRQKSQLLSYFGTGETFLFTLWPEKKKYEWVGLTQENIPNTASMFQAGDRTILTVGGGHGEAISLDENLLHCRSEKCDTFNNEPLSKSEDFQCKVVEVYGFV
ncbi:GTPase-activating protein skywalker-like [Mercenaria mercenaria]|uniref:GTPase-activating protein skywalker-like n=1 Tax=Mercenaria mercenaria TaxID=6596 RepID=UPI00234F6F3B|nr:GTPase-activating protein skywalker-like [Mercenaria mercenaria]